MSEINPQVENVRSIYLDSINQWDEAHRRAEMCYLFMMNEQWNDEEVKKFLKMKQPPIVYNLILPRIFNLLGTEQMNRRSTYIKPFYSTQRELASVLTGVFNQVWETQAGEDELAKAFADGLIMPVAGKLKIKVEPDETGFMDYRFEALNPFSVMFDPYHSDYRLRDAQYIFQESWLRMDEIIDLYGKQEGMEPLDRNWYEKLQDKLETGFNNLMGLTDRQSQFYDKKRNLYKVIEMQTRVTREKPLFMNLQTGEYMLLESDVKRNDVAGLKYINQSKVKKIHLTTICPYLNSVLLDKDNWLDTDMYDVIPYYSIDFNNIKSKNSSLVWAMIDPQKNLNKREIQKTSYIDRAMVSPMVFSYEDRDAKDEYDEKGGNPQYSMLVRNLKFPPHRIAPNQMTGDVWNDIADSKDKMNDISGINDTARGQSEYSNESARLFQMKSERVGATINPYLKNLSKTRRMIGEYFLQTCRQVYPEMNRLVGTLDRNKKEDSVVLNYTDGVTVRNQVSSFVGQVVIDEGERSATKVQENFQRKYALATMMPPEFVNWEWVLKDSELPDVQEQIDYIKAVLGIQADNSAMQNAMQQNQFAHQQNMDEQKALNESEKVQKNNTKTNKKE